MKTILFPSDFSKSAAVAAEYAGLLARCFDAKIVMLNVYSVPVISEYQLPYEIENFLEISKEAAKSDLKAFTEKFVEKTNFPASKITERVEYGFISDKIVDVAKSIHADYIVMGTKGATNALDRWMGTNAQKVMKSAECPVWIIPQNADMNYPQNILYAADFEKDEVLATQKVVEIAKAFSANCKVVHVHDYYEVNVNDGVEEMVSYLEDSFENEPVSVKNIDRADIIEGLESYIKVHKPDVLALSLHEKSFFGKLFDTSVARHFVQEAKLPLLVFRK